MLILSIAENDRLPYQIQNSTEDVFNIQGLAPI